MGLGGEGGDGAGQEDLSRKAAMALSLETFKPSFSKKCALYALMTCAQVNESSCSFVKKPWAAWAADGGRAADTPATGLTGLTAAAAMEAKE